MPGWGWYERDTNLRRHGPADADHRVRQCRPRRRAWRRSTWPRTRSTTSTASGARAQRTARSRTSSTGPMRLFSQLAQDCELKLGKVLWIAGHAGPETAEDSRTHFGIFETHITQLFPEGHVIDLHPWEYNEVPVVLAAAFATDVPIVALHVTRPAIDIPDREALGIPSHFEAARGAYVMRDFKPGQPRGGTVFVQGTTSTANLVKVLPQLDERGLNVKIVACISPAAVRHAGRGLSRGDDLPGRPMGRHGDHQSRLDDDAPLDRRPDRTRLLALVRLGRPLAHRRHGRRGDRRGAPRPDAHRRRDPALRRRARDRAWRDCAK